MRVFVMSELFKSISEKEINEIKRFLKGFANEIDGIESAFNITIETFKKYKNGKKGYGYVPLCAGGMRGILESLMNLAESDYNNFITNINQTPSDNLSKAKSGVINTFNQEMHKIKNTLKNNIPKDFIAETFLHNRIVYNNSDNLDRDFNEWNRSYSILSNGIHKKTSWHNSFNDNFSKCIQMLSNVAKIYLSETKNADVIDDFFLQDDLKYQETKMQYLLPHVLSNKKLEQYFLNKLIDYNNADKLFDLLENNYLDKTVPLSAMEGDSEKSEVIYPAFMAGSYFYKTLPSITEKVSGKVLEYVKNIAAQENPNLGLIMYFVHILRDYNNKNDNLNPKLVLDILVQTIPVFEKFHYRDYLISHNIPELIVYLIKNKILEKDLIKYILKLKDPYGSKVVSDNVDDRSYESFIEKVLELGYVEIIFEELVSSFVDLVNTKPEEERKLFLEKVVLKRDAVAEHKQNDKWLYQTFHFFVDSLRDCGLKLISEGNQRVFDLLSREVKVDNGVMKIPLFEKISMHLALESKNIDKIYNYLKQDRGDHGFFYFKYELYHLQEQGIELLPDTQKADIVNELFIREEKDTITNLTEGQEKVRKLRAWYPLRNYLNGENLEKFNFIRDEVRKIWNFEKELENGTTHFDLSSWSNGVSTFSPKSLYGKDDIEKILNQPNGIELLIQEMKIHSSKIDDFRNEEIYFAEECGKVLTSKENILNFLTNLDKFKDLDIKDIYVLRIMDHFYFNAENRSLEFFDKFLEFTLWFKDSREGYISASFARFLNKFHLNVLTEKKSETLCDLYIKCFNVLKRNKYTRVTWSMVDFILNDEGMIALSGIFKYLEFCSKSDFTKTADKVKAYIISIFEEIKSYTVNSAFLYVYGNKFHVIWNYMQDWLNDNLSQIFNVEDKMKFSYMWLGYIENHSAYTPMYEKLKDFYLYSFKNSFKQHQARFYDQQMANQIYHLILWGRIELEDEISDFVFQNDAICSKIFSFMAWNTDRDVLVEKDDLIKKMWQKLLDGGNILDSTLNQFLELYKMDIFDTQYSIEVINKLISFKDSNFASISNEEVIKKITLDMANHPNFKDDLVQKIIIPAFQGNGYFFDIIPKEVKSDFIKEIKSSKFSEEFFGISSYTLSLRGAFNSSKN